MTDANRFAEAASALEGTRFRLHGRNPATGLDCVGLVASALEIAGRPAICPTGYALRNIEIDHYLAFANRNGFAAFTGPVATGDLLLVRPGPAQAHLLIATATNQYVHAHASLRQVVEQDGPLAWPICAQWRLAPTIED